MNAKLCILCAAILGASGVAMGAFQSHGLAKMLEASQSLEPDILARRVATCGDGVRYQLYHAIALLGLAGVTMRQSSALFSIAAMILFVGTVVFAGSLYAIVFANEPFYGRVAPIGGVLLIIGWTAIGLGAILMPKAESNV